MTAPIVKTPSNASDSSKIEQVKKGGAHSFKVTVLSAGTKAVSRVNDPSSLGSNTQRVKFTVDDRPLSDKFQVAGKIYNSLEEAQRINFFERIFNYLYKCWTHHDREVIIKLGDNTFIKSNYNSVMARLFAGQLKGNLSDKSADDLGTMVTDRVINISKDESKDKILALIEKSKEVRVSYKIGEYNYISRRSTMIELRANLLYLTQAQKNVKELFSDDTSYQITLAKYDLIELINFYEDEILKIAKENVEKGEAKTKPVDMMQQREAEFPKECKEIIKKVVGDILKRIEEKISDAKNFLNSLDNTHLRLIEIENGLKDLEEAYEKVDAMLINFGDSDQDLKIALEKAFDNMEDLIEKYHKKLLEIAQKVVDSCRDPQSREELTEQQRLIIAKCREIVDLAKSSADE